MDVVVDVVVDVDAEDAAGNKYSVNFNITKQIVQYKGALSRLYLRGCQNMNSLIIHILCSLFLSYAFATECAPARRTLKKAPRKISGSFTFTILLC